MQLEASLIEMTVTAIGTVTGIAIGTVNGSVSETGNGIESRNESRNASKSETDIERAIEIGMTGEARIGPIRVTVAGINIMTTAVTTTATTGTKTILPDAIEARIMIMMIAVGALDEFFYL